MVAATTPNQGGQQVSRLRGVAAMGAAVGALAVAAAPAAAHPDTSAGAARLCGAGFHIAKDPDGTPARRPVRLGGSGRVLGHVYLTYNANNGRNCVITIKTASHGVATSMYAGLKVQGRSG